MSKYSDILQKIYPTGHLYDALLPKPSNKDMADLSEYGLENLGIIGEGAFSKVYIVCEKKSRKIYACKYTSLRNPNAKPSFIAEHTLREIRCMKNIQKRNIYGSISLIKYYPSENAILDYIQRYKNKFSFLVPQSAVILQLMPIGVPYETFIESYFRSGRKLNEKDIAALILDLVYPLQYFHQKANLIHRDIKPGNILLVKSSNGRVHAAISDFNISREFTDSTMTCIGSKGFVNLSYMDKVRNKTISKSESEKNDVYAVGQIIYILLNTTMAPIRGTIPPPKYSPSVCITKLLQKMLSPDIGYVLTTQEVIRRCEEIIRDGDSNRYDNKKRVQKKYQPTKIYKR